MSEVLERLARRPEISPELRALADIVQDPYLHTARQHLADLRNPLFSPYVAKLLATKIRTAIKERHITWKKLDTSAGHITRLVNASRIRWARSEYDMLIDPTYTRHHVAKMAAHICAVVDDRAGTWRELGFTRKDVQARVKAAKTRTVFDPKKAREV